MREKEEPFGHRTPSDENLHAQKNLRRLLLRMMQPPRMSALRIPTGCCGPMPGSRSLPFARGPSWAHAKSFARAFSEAMAKDEPGRFTINSCKDVRKGRIFIDYLRNDETTSAVAAYSVRGLARRSPSRSTGTNSPNSRAARLSASRPRSRVGPIPGRMCNRPDVRRFHCKANKLVSYHHKDCAAPGVE